MNVSRVGVDFLVDIGYACNLVSTSLCKRLGAAIDPQEQAMVGFGEDKRVTLGQASIQTQVGEWKQKLCFHVVNGRVLLILGYPGLKSLQLTVDCKDNILTSWNGKVLICHAIGALQES